MAAGRKNEADHSCETISSTLAQQRRSNFLEWPTRGLPGVTLFVMAALLMVLLQGPALVVDARATTTSLVPPVWGRRMAGDRWALTVRGGSDFDDDDNYSNKNIHYESSPSGVEEDDNPSESAVDDDEWFDAEAVLPPIKETDEEDFISEAWDDATQEDSVEDNAEDEEETEFDTKSYRVARVNMAVPRNEEGEEEQTETTSSFSSEVVMDNPAIDDNDSSTYVDRMDLADAYDEDILLDTDAGNTDGGSNEGMSSNVASAVEAVEEDATTIRENLPQVETMSEDMKRILIKELKYRRTEVEEMKPDIAAVVVSKKLKRPYEGMPENWYRNGKPLSKPQHPIIKVLPKIVIPVLVGALTIAKGPDVVSALTSPRSSSKVSEYASHTKETYLSTEHATLTSTQETATTAFSDSENTAMTKRPSVLPVNEHTSALGEVHPHSVPPGQVPKDDPLDVTWLDKLITAVERRLKAFFRWNI